MNEQAVEVRTFPQGPEHPKSGTRQEMEMASKEQRMHSAGAACWEQTSADESVVNFREKIGPVRLQILCGTKFHDTCSSEASLKLASVAWVQCDNASCLKWRKVRKEVAERLTKDTIWTCDHNEDANYSRWPALITADPLNGQHLDGDEFDIEWYHVEFLGGERTHGWVRSKYVDVFGPGNTHVMTETGTNFKHSQSGKKMPKRNKTAASKRKDKKTYRGNHTVEEAIEEALRLLPLKLGERVQTCQFRGQGNDIIGTKGQKSYMLTRHKKHIQSQYKRKIEKTDASGRGCVENDRYSSDKKRPRCQKKKCMRRCSQGPGVHKSVSISAKENYDVTEKANDRRGWRPGILTETHVNRNQYDRPKEAGFLGFSSSLLDVSREERLMLDVQMYQEREQTFKHDVVEFMIRHGLKLAAEPVWQNVKVSYFSLFLAIDERSGFAKVCENHLWPSVYTEVAHQYCKSGGSMAKKYYKRNLYAYELHASDQDCSLLIDELMEQEKKRTKKVAQSDAGDSGFCADDAVFQSQDSDDFDNPDVIKELNELDQLLKTIETETQLENGDKIFLEVRGEDVCDHGPVVKSNQNMENEDSVVPGSQTNTKPLIHHSSPKWSLSPHMNILTGSELGLPHYPEENAQVVPELDFPSSVSSSNDLMNSQNSDEGKVLHEMQALHCDMDALQDQIDLL